MPVLKNTRWELFAQEVAKGSTATAAYETAGYAPSDANASKLLNRPEVQGRIQEITGAGAERAEITVELVLRELAKMGFSNMLDYVQITEDGQPYLDMTKLTRDQAAAIQEVTVDVVTEYEQGEDGKKVPVQVRKARFKLADKRAALVDIGKHLGAFKDRVEHTGRDGNPIQIEDATGAAALLRGRIAGVRERLGITQDPRRLN
jgi:phage terminase small subunit